MTTPPYDATEINDAHIFSGALYIFHAYDIGDDVNLAQIEQKRAITTVPLSLPKYFKNYHMPLAVELPHPNESARCISTQINNFGAISLTYKIPFTSTLEELKRNFLDVTNNYIEQSVIDVKSVYRRIERYVTQPKFFQTSSSYIVIQVDPIANLELTQVQKQYGGVIASILRFETETLSEEQKNEILESAMGYYRGDMIIVDTDATFVYADEYEEILDFFEFANIQQLELRYFDRLLDQRLNKMYEGKAQKIPVSAYFPFSGLLSTDPVVGLGKLKVDILVITERLEGSIKLAGEPYFSELYSMLVQKLDLKNWHDSINRKLTIIEDIQSIYQHKTDVIREDMLSVLIIVLIFIELVIGALSYFK